MNAAQSKKPFAGLLVNWLYFLPLAIFHNVINFWYPYIFDDAFIGFRISRNMAEGHWLVYNAGELELTNTSFLYPFLNGIQFLIFGENGIHAALFTDVLFHTFTLAILLIWLGKLLPRLKEAYPVLFPVFGAALLYFFSLRLTMQITCGMETQLYVLIIVSAFYLYYCGSTLAAVVVGALAFWVRPDGFLVPAVLLTADLITGKTIKPRLLLAAAGIGLFLFAYNFAVYGTMLPLSIMAKKQVALPGIKWSTEMGKFFLNLVNPMQSRSFLLFIVPGIIASLRIKALRPFTAWWLLYFCFFTFIANWMYAWYGHAFFMGWYFLSAAGWLSLTGTLTERNRSKPVITGTWALSALVIGYGLYAFATRIEFWELTKVTDCRTAQAKGINQTLLNSGASKEGYVCLEPLGYIGYYCPQFKFADFPGLCNRKVIATHKQLGRKLTGFSMADDVPAFANLLRNMEFSALVLRDNEYKNSLEAGILNGYTVAGTVAPAECNHSNKNSEEKPVYVLKK